jgi:hypothetical protein
MRRTTVVVAALFALAACSKGKEESAGSSSETAKGGEQVTDSDEPKPASGAHEETVELEVKLLDEKVRVSLEVPAGWEVADNIFGGPAWRPNGSRSTYFQIDTGCEGKCTVDAIGGNIDEVLEAKRNGVTGVGTATDSRYEPMKVEIVTDEKQGDAYLIHRRLPEVRGAPQRFNVLCLVHRESMPFFVSLAAIGDLKDEEAHLPGILAACKSMTIDESDRREGDAPTPVDGQGQR